MSEKDVSVNNQQTLIEETTPNFYKEHKGKPNKYETYAASENLEDFYMETEKEIILSFAPKF